MGFFVPVDKMAIWMSPQKTDIPFEPIFTNPDDQVFLAFPCYGSEVKTPFMLSLLALYSQSNAFAKIDVISNDSLVCRARNTHAARFLEATHPTTGKPMQWLLFIDTDIEFQPWHVTRLIRDAIADGGKSIFCGMYPLKQTKPHFVCNSLPGETIDANGHVRVREGGTGFMLIHRSILERMRDTYPELAFECDNNESGATKTETRWDFFSVGVYYDKVSKKRRYLSEDYYFCQRWRDMGGSVIMDTLIQTKHHGNMTFPIPPNEIAAAASVYERAAELIAKKQQEAK